MSVAASPASAQETRSIFQQFFWSDDPLGVGIIWLLVILSFVNLGYALMLLLQYRRATLLPEDFQEELSTLLGEKKYREAIDVANGDNSYLGSLSSAALNEASAGYTAMERAIADTGDAETSRMLRPIEYLNVLGNIAPMLGLFGTVYGMIVAFQRLVEASGAPNPADLAAGIATALVTTFWGLIVAIPALAAYAIVRNRIDALTSEGIIIAEKMIAPFKPGGSGRKSSGSSSGGSGSPRPRAQPKPSDAKPEG